MTIFIKFSRVYLYFEYLGGVEAVSDVLIIGGVNIDPEVVDVPCGTKVAKGNGIPEGANNASGTGSDYDLNDSGL